MASMIRNWKTKRSGARMTITGTGMNGEAVKVSADELSAPAAPGAYPLAIDKKTGRTFLLAC